MVVNKKESKDSLLFALRNIVKTVESDMWDVDEASINIDNNNDIFAKVIVGKDINISLKLKPKTNIRTVEYGRFGKTAYWMR